jgi:hypothetical protein
MPPPPPTVFARTQVPATRIATGPLSAVANARPDRLGAQRLTRMTDELAQGTTVHEGEVVVIGLGTRGTEKQPDRLAVRGGPTRILALAAGGNVLFDSVAGADLKRGAESAELAVPAKAERVIVAALGSAAGHGGALDGWYAGQSLPLIGWDMALGAGTVVTFHRHRVRANRERRDGGYANTRALAAESAHVATRFDAPVTAVAIAIDDAAATAGDAATALGMRLVGAARALGADGQPEPPSILVQGVRTILVYAVVPDAPERRAHANRARARAGLKELDPNVLVVVDGARRGHLVGVAGTTGSVPELLKTMARAGFDAAIRAPLLGGTGSRTVVWTSAHRSADRS